MKFCECVCACVDPSGICDCGRFLNQHALDMAREVGYLTEREIQRALGDPVTQMLSTEVEELSDAVAEGPWECPQCGRVSSGWALRCGSCGARDPSFSVTESEVTR